MQIVPLSQNYAVAGQITPDDVAEIAAQGYRAIMCNRPDHEEAGQPPFAEIAAAAEAAGLAVAYVPVISGRIIPADVEAFAAALAHLPAPVLAYCRSGARCQHLRVMMG